MPARKTITQIVDEYADMGSRLAFSMQDGVGREGYIIDIGTKNFLFGDGGPLAPEGLETLALGDLDLTTLSFFDGEEGCWKDAKWNDDSQRWRVTKTVIG